MVCSLLLFAVPQFSEPFRTEHKIRMLPYLLPLAHVGLMGSVYSTVALTLERFLAVSYPFLPHRFDVLEP